MLDNLKIQPLIRINNINTAKVPIYFLIIPYTEITVEANFLLIS